MNDTTDPPSGDAPGLAPADLPGLNGLVTLLVSVVVISVLFVAREVLIPITLAVLLSFLLAPLVHRLRELHLGRVPSVLIAAALGIGMVLGIAGLIGIQLADLAAKVPEYTYTIEHKVEAVRSYAVSHISGVINRLQEAAPPAAKPPPSAGGKTGASAPPAPVPVEVQSPPLGAMTLAQNVLAPILSPLVTAGIVFVVTIFVLLQREDLRDRFIRLFGSGDLHRTTVAMNDAGKRLSRYFLAQLSVNAAFGCVIGLGLALIGVPSPVLWGLMGMLLRFVPYIGSPLAAVLPIALAAAIDPGWSTAVWTAVLFLVVELLTGQVIEPLLYGHSTGLSPVAVIVAAIFWTWIWGPIGLILSMPMTLCLVVLGRHVKRLEFLDILLGDRPALTPVESFYQRMLAGDPDEAQEQAEVILKERPLSAYYDAVVLPGLQLAASDAQRGALTSNQLNRLRGAVEALVRDLDDHPDAPAVADAGEPDPDRVVLCIAGRGPLDEAASLILAQLLSKHGLATRTVPHSAGSRSRVASLSLEGVGMVCIPHLELEGAPAHLRNLVRRIRQRLPSRPILIGLWPSGDQLLLDQSLRASLGADFYVTSFHAAVEACVETVRRGAPEHPRAALTAA